ncbi:hypothetical protein JOC94_001542 [Bacillus thermophilus]|uniref:Uncharacterized protein n=1 Tax=Siminovitchia thermophila TaxID=1245522 RepID=A0ABS2R593_9BACI|nr:hypothetical protein [Siminovitchia thermophila]
MDQTITGAASGETVIYAAPKDSQSQAKGQKSNIRTFMYVILLTFGDWRDPIFFYVYNFKKGAITTWRKDAQLSAWLGKIK